MAQFTFVFAVALMLASHVNAQERAAGGRKSKIFEFDVSFASKVQQIKNSVGASSSISEHTRKLIETLNSAADFDLQNLRRELGEGSLTASAPAYGPSYGPPPSYGPSYPPRYGADLGSPPAIIEPVVQTPKNFVLTLQADYTLIASMLSVFTVETQNAIAARLNLNAQRVVITRVAPGSVIVDFDVMTDNTFSDSEVTNLVAALVSAPAQIFPASFTQKYGISSTAVALASTTPPGVIEAPTTSPPAGTTTPAGTPPATTTPAGTPPTSTTPSGSSPNPTTGSSPSLTVNQPPPVPLGASKASFRWMLSLMASMGALLLASML